MRPSFSVQATDARSAARVGRLKTAHGEVETPTWIPVGTAATVKGLTPQDIQEIGAQMVLANTYHLHLRPGEDTVDSFGGFGPFMGWNGPTMTDSGGYQVFSLGSAQKYDDAEGKKLSKFSSAPFEEDRLKPRKTQPIRPAKMDEQGVTFYSHLDGSEHRLDPESAIMMQEKLGADLIVAFDDHESPLWTYEQTKASLERTNRWGLESLKAQKRADQLMYGVVHGGVFEDLRKESAEFTNKHFGAVSIGGSYTSKEILYKVLDWSVPYFDTDKPRHLLGIGEVQDLFEGVSRGMDFFDCVAPTRRARHGSIYIGPQNEGRPENNFALQITNERYIKSQEPLDPGCECMVCSTFTRGYINHLFRAKELLAYRLATYHNVYFMTHLGKLIREAISQGSFIDLKNQWLS
jgi:queuine tRNA-ribosyltransferase